MRYRTTLIVAGLVVLGAGLSGMAQYGGYGGQPGMDGRALMGGYGPAATVRPAIGATFVQTGGVMVNPENITFTRQTDAGLEFYFTGGPSIVLQGDEAARLLAAIGGGQVGFAPGMRGMGAPEQPTMLSPVGSPPTYEESKVDNPPPFSVDGPVEPPKSE